MNRCCSICDELRLDGRSRLGEALGDSSIHNAVLCSSRHYVVIPSIGPLAMGHSLLVTRDHRKSILRSVDAGQLIELSTLLRGLYESGFVRRAGAETILCFEHGTSKTSDVELCSTSHAHLHVVPLQSTQLADVHRVLGRRDEMDQVVLDDLSSMVSRLEEYIAYFEFGADAITRGARVFNASGRPSQYMRRVIMRCLGSQNWDWKVDPRASIVRRAIDLGFKLNVRSNGARKGRESALA